MTDPDNKESDLERLAKERDEYLDGWKRAEANLINYKKDELKRFQESVLYVSEELLGDLIPVLDSFDLAIGTLEAGGQVEKGIYMIKNQLESVLAKRGLSKIVVRVGDKFDPNRHEAIEEVKGGESGTVAQELTPGYELGYKVLRPSKVKVFK